MGLEKSIQSGRERRKPFRGSKVWDSGCRNHGSCSYCERNRLLNRNDFEHNYEYVDYIEDKFLRKESLTLEEIAVLLTELIKYAIANETMNIYFPEECLSGVLPSEAAPLFVRAIKYPNIILPESIKNHLKK